MGSRKVFVVGQKVTGAEQHGRALPGQGPAAPLLQVVRSEGLRGVPGSGAGRPGRAAVGSEGVYGAPRPDPPQEN